MAFTEDHTEFFDTADFAVAATFGDSIGSVNGIFDNEYAEDLGVNGTLPVFQCATSDITAASEGTTVTVNSTNYTVAELKPDGTGQTLVVLKSV